MSIMNSTKTGSSQWIRKVEATPSTQAERNRRHREKSRKAGIVSVTVEIPIERRDELRAIAADMRRGKE